MNVGTEGVVPWYCGPLAVALEKGYGISGLALDWLKTKGIVVIQSSDVLSECCVINVCKKVANCERKTCNFSILLS
jgi:hypothetical protein